MYFLCCFSIFFFSFLAYSFRRSVNKSVRLVCYLLLAQLLPNARTNMSVVAFSSSHFQRQRFLNFVLRHQTSPSSPSPQMKCTFFRTRNVARRARRKTNWEKFKFEWTKKKWKKYVFCCKELIIPFKNVLCPWKATHTHIKYINTRQRKWSIKRIET